MKHRLVHLDFLRGTAALLVCISHLSGFLFIPFGKIASPGIIEKAFYFLSALGHQAVLLFFVLSGYLVGGSVIRSYQMGRWSWRDYLLRRLTRLWMVLIPALLLTLLWDSLGGRIHAEGYTGIYHHIYGSGPETGALGDLSVPAFLGNLLFLQTIVVPVYGSNSPLWSISNEFWYYLLFPLLIAIVLMPRYIGKIISLLLSASLLVFLPKVLVNQGLAWVLGAGVFPALQNPRIRRIAAHPIFFLLALGIVAVVLLLSRMGKLGNLFDLVLGLSFVPLVASCAVLPVTGGLYARLSAAASEFSYTLYLVHFPLMAFLFFSFMRGRQITLTPSGMGLFLAILALVIVYATFIWWCFERKTDAFRRSLERQLMPKSSIP